MAGNEVEIRVTKKNDANLDQLGRDAKQAGKQIGDGLEKGFKEGEQAGDRMRKKVGQDLDKTAKDAEQAGAKAGKGFGTKLGETANTAVSEGAEGMFTGLLENVKGGGAVAAAGLGIGALIVDTVSTKLQEGALGGMLAASIEGAAGEAGRLGGIAGDVWADNFGDSLEDAAGGIKAIMQNKLIDPHATDEAIRKMTGLVLTASQLVGEEANNVARAARQMLVNGLAGSAEEAFDIIVASSQRGLNVNEDLIDTTIEYSTKFRDLGLTGQEAMGLIGQAMDAGARDTDTAADALKEFAIRAIDGSEATARGFEAIGLNAQDMGHSIAAGGTLAHDALGKTLAALRAIENPVERNQAAVDLFGTKAEDLGDALFNMDLDTVADQFGDVANATSKASDEMTRGSTKVEGYWRQAKQGAGDTLGWLGAAWKSFTGDVTDLTHLTTGALNDNTTGLDDNREAQKVRAREAAAAWEQERDSIVRTTKTLAENIQMHQDAAGVVMDIAQAEMRYQQSIDDAAEALKKNKKNLDINTEAGRDNKSALLDMADAAYRQIEAMEKQGATTENVRQFMGGAREEFVRMATSMGLSAAEANRLADKLRLIPGNYSATVGVVDAGASNTIETIRGHLVNLTNRRWIASVAVTGTGMSGGGRYFAGLASGGAVGGGIPTAADGGARGSMFLAHEQGPELIQEPTGSVVIPAGMSRAMMSGWMNGGGMGGPPQAIEMRISGDLDGWFATLLRKMNRDGLLGFAWAGR